MSTVDFAEVSRTAHQLALDHGHSAYLYAANLSRELSAAGRQNEAEFWKAVSAALTPR
jgi:ribosomal protein L18E